MQGDAGDESGGKLGLRKDLWKSGICHAPIAEILKIGGLARFEVTWLPECARSFQFRADPFGVWYENRLYVFSEVYDYRVRRGEIEVCVYDARYRLLHQDIVLRESWHLSYPHVVLTKGQWFMLPEAYRSGGLTLYQATNFPLGWKAIGRIDLGDDIPVDASIFQANGLWWLFYTPIRAIKSARNCLHVAYAREITGPWHSHQCNPVRIDQMSGRPAGPMQRVGGEMMLPVQDCSSSYGAAVSPLWIDHLDERDVRTHVGERLSIPMAFRPFDEGMHTLSACGAVTLFDVKRRELSLRGLSIELKREAKRALSFYARGIKRVA